MFCKLGGQNGISLNSHNRNCYCSTLVMTKRPPSTVTRSNSLPEEEFVGMGGKEQVVTPA